MDTNVYNVYGDFKPSLRRVMENLVKKIEDNSERHYEKTGFALFEHISQRIKTEESMVEKCMRKNVPPTPESALGIMKDAIGIRIVTSYIDDIWENVEFIRTLQDVKIINEKDYIRHAKDNGYRSYHLILVVESPDEDYKGDIPGHFFVEVQLRTIAMDSWAALEHNMKYKKNVKNQELIVSELKRVADEMNACDLSMKTIRELIRNSEL